MKNVRKTYVVVLGIELKNSNKHRNKTHVSVEVPVCKRDPYTAAAGPAHQSASAGNPNLPFVFRTCC